MLPVEFSLIYRFYFVFLLVKCCLHVAVEEGVGGGEEGGQVGHLDGLQKEDQKAIHFQNC